jgi:hypothetical protein
MTFERVADKSSAKVSDDRILPFRGRSLPNDERFRALVAKVDLLPPERQTVVETAIDLMMLFDQLSDEERLFVLGVLERLHGMSIEDRETTLRFLADACERRSGDPG